LPYSDFQGNFPCTWFAHSFGNRCRLSFLDFFKSSLPFFSGGL
jgi:hypothetical protein